MNKREKMNRNGAAIVIVLVLMVLLGGFMAFTVREFSENRKVRVRERIHTQAELFSETAFERAERIRSENPEFNGDLLVITAPSKEFRGTFTLKSVRENESKKFRIECEYRDENGKVILVKRTDKKAEV